MNPVSMTIFLGFVFLNFHFYV